MSKKDIVDELMNEWEAAKMDTPHGLPAFKKAADEIKRLREENKECDKAVVRSLLELRDSREENKRLREEIKRVFAAAYDVLDSARGGDYGEVVWDEEDFNTFEKIIDKIENEVSDE